MQEEIAIFVYGDSGFDDASGSRFSDLIAKLRDRLPEFTIEGGIDGSPNFGLKLGLDTLAQRAPKTVTCVPATLFGAAHAQKNLPEAIQTFQTDHPQIHLLFARDLVVDGRLLAAARDSIVNCERQQPLDGDYHQALLMLVGRQSMSPDENANVAKAARLLWEGMGFGWAEVSYCGDTRPSVSTGMDHALKLGFKRIVVLPAFLYAEQNIAAISASVEKIAAANSDLEIVQAEQFQDHPLLVESLVDRIDEALQGSNAMNCLHCAYREQVIGVEDHSHDAAQPHSHTHDHDHDHEHHHGHSHPQKDE